MFGELSAIFNKFEIVVCKLFQFGSVQNVLFEKGILTDWSKLTAYAEIELKDISPMIEFVFERIGNSMVKGENAGIPAFSSFPTMFS